jgi:5-methylcytosine-specific restriction endonuclease McrA
MAVDRYANQRRPPSWSGGSDVDLMLRPCLDCGRLATGSRCGICASTRNRTNPYTTQSWRQLSLAVVVRDGACVRCGGGHRLSAHHITPRVEGGPDALENLEALCVRCHGRASADERRSCGT